MGESSGHEHSVGAHALHAAAMADALDADPHGTRGSTVHRAHPAPDASFPFSYALGAPLCTVFPMFLALGGPMSMSMSMSMYVTSSLHAPPCSQSQMRSTTAAK